MGLDQVILRGKHDVPVKINQETGEWENAEEIIRCYKSYWLHYKMLDIGFEKLGLDYKELNCKYIPITKEELLQIVNQGKEISETKSPILLKKYFDVNPESPDQLEYILTDIRDFNVSIMRYLKNSKKTEYWYWAWW